jgi:hypothetical protein
LDAYANGCISSVTPVAVVLETPSSCAVSSSDKPSKKRSSMIRACAQPRQVVERIVQRDEVRRRVGGVLHSAVERYLGGSTATLARPNGPAWSTRIAAHQLCRQREELRSTVERVAVACLPALE